LEKLILFNNKMSNQRLDKRKSNDENNIDSPTPKKTRKQTKL
jgi:hypothetical protein